jgi:hypothetical protein
MKLERTIWLSDVSLIEQAVREQVLVNPGDPSAGFYRAYLAAARKSLDRGRDLDPLIRYIGEDYELAALYAQICARIGDGEAALKWLEHSVERGNYDLVRMRHGDFRGLEQSRRFASLMKAVEARAAGILDAIRRWEAGTDAR